MELIRLEDIHKTYYLGQIDVPVLRGVSLSIEAGELVALMGASGSGKTTLMNILGCLDRPTGGRYWLDGDEMSGLRPDQRAIVRTRKLGFVFQSFNLLARTSALHNVLMPLDYSLQRPSEREAYQRAYALLDRVGLGDRADHEPTQMSGGQQQRVAIARALINQPPLLLADEPTGNLDTHTSAEILEMFKQLNAEGITIILVTHNPEVAQHAQRVIHVKDGVIVDGGRRATVMAAAPPSGGHGEIDTVDDSGRPAASSPPAAVASGSVATALARAATPASLVAGGNGAGGHSGNGAGAAAAPVAEPSVHPSPGSGNGVTVALPAAPLAAQAPPRRTGGGWAWSFALPPTLRTALGALRRNKMRSLLTALGIIIGVGAVIAMIEIGQGSKVTIQATISSMGANNLMILPGAAASGGVSFGSGSITTLTPADADEILRQCTSVEEVAPVVRARAQVVYANRNWIPMYIYGTTAEFLVVRDWEGLSEGEMFGDRDVRNSSKVCVIGATIARELFGEESPLDKEIRLQNVSFRVVGVLRRKGANMMGMDQDDIVLAPWTTIKLRVSGMSTANNAASSSSSSSSLDKVNSLNNLYPGATALYPAPSAAQQANTPQLMRPINVDQIIAKAISADHVQVAISQITEVLRERHRIQASQPSDFNIRDMTELTQTVTQTSNTIGLLLIIVACVSMIVGGVGIMNIMLVSVTERTREIGLRMAVGARAGNILQQFLVEAVVLCLLGGAVGVAFGRSMSTFVQSWLGWPIEMSLPAIVGSVLMSAGVGVIFGFYPAWKASRLDPIEALRYE